MVDEFPGNSRRIIGNPAASRPEETKPQDRKVEPVVVGKVIRRKKSLGKRFMETFFSGDSNGVLNYLVRDVLVPAFQATVTDVISQGIEKAVYGEVRTQHRSSRPGGIGSRNITSYDRYSAAPRPTVSAPVGPRRAPSRSSQYDVGDIVLETRMEAQDVLETMSNILDQYDIVTVGDLYSLTKEPTQPQDYKFGWTDLSHADMRRVREGYMLILPQPEDLRT